MVIDKEYLQNFTNLTLSSALGTALLGNWSMKNLAILTLSSMKITGLNSALIYGILFKIY